MSCGGPFGNMCALLLLVGGGGMSAGRPPGLQHTIGVDVLAYEGPYELESSSGEVSVVSMGGDSVAGVNRSLCTGDKGAELLPLSPERSCGSSSYESIVTRSAVQGECLDTRREK